MISTSRAFHLLVALSLVSGLSSSGAREVSPNTATLVIASGSSKGVYFGYGHAISAELARRGGALRAYVRPTSGSMDNLDRVANGRADLAFAAADAVVDAYSGRRPFSATAPLRAVARMYDDYVHLVVRAGSAMRRLDDVSGLTVSIGPRGSGTALIARRVLMLAGLDGGRVKTVALSLDDSIEAVRTGRVDGFFWSGGLPTRGVAELATSFDVRLISLGEFAGAMRERYGFAYRAATIPQGTYADVDATSTVAVPNYLVARAAADPNVIYELTAILFDRKDAIARSVPVARSLDAASAIFTEPIALHSGALRYYREQKP